MSSARRRHLSVVAAAAVIALAMSGCSGPEDAYDGAWGGADEVIADANEAGFDCSFDESKSLLQVLTEHPVTKEPLGGSLVLCQGFQVLLLEDPASYTDTIRGDCASVTTQSLESPAMGRAVVVGDNYIISGTGPDQAFPEGAPSGELAEAFGGTQKTLLEYYQELCAGVPAVEGTPGPTSALPSASTIR